MEVFNPAVSVSGRMQLSGARCWWLVVGGISLSIAVFGVVQCDIAVAGTWYSLRQDVVAVSLASGSRTGPCGILAAVIPPGKRFAETNTDGALGALWNEQRDRLLKRRDLLYTHVLPYYATKQACMCKQEVKSIYRSSQDNLPFPLPLRFPSPPLTPDKDG